MSKLGDPLNGRSYFNLDIAGGKQKVVIEHGEMGSETAVQVKDYGSKNFIIDGHNEHSTTLIAGGCDVFIRGADRDAWLRVRNGTVVAIMGDQPGVGQHFRLEAVDDAKKPILFGDKVFISVAADGSYLYEQQHWLRTGGSRGEATIFVIQPGSDTGYGTYCVRFVDSNNTYVYEKTITQTSDADYQRQVDQIKAELKAAFGRCEVGNRKPGPC